MIEKESIGPSFINKIFNYIVSLFLMLVIEIHVQMTLIITSSSNKDIIQNNTSHSMYYVFVWVRNTEQVSESSLIA